MSVPGPVLGPCTSWIDGGDVEACCGVTASDDQRDTAAVEASMALFEISGRQFTGLCGPREVRPCRQSCGCWGTAASGLGPWAWGWGGAYGGWGWFNECGDRCGCGHLSKVKLAGYPVREIVEVKIDGQVVDPATYRLDGWRWLVRLDDAGPPLVPGYWPACQNLALDDSEAGTFSVSYRWGVDPPQLGRDAAVQIACQILAACQAGGGAECVLPVGATKIVRENITVERGILANWLDPTRTTGLAAVDLFLKAYAVRGSRRRPAVWSPDVQQYPVKVGA